MTRINKGLRKARCVRKKMARGISKTRARVACGVKGARKAARRTTRRHRR